MNKNMNWTVLGGGNGGQTTAAHLGMMGFDVVLYDIFEETTQVIEDQGGIHLEDALVGFGKVSCATTNIKKALQDADIVLITVPATAHKSVAKACAKYLKDGQIILLNPAATFGSIEFDKTLNDEGCTADITIAETNTLLYGCRIIEPGRIQVFGLKSRVLVAALPATEINKVVAALHTAFPQFEAVDSVLITSFDNTNPILHPATTLLNTGTIESDRTWYFYIDGFTPSIGHFVEKMDEERIEIGRSLGLELLSCREQLEIEYNVFNDTLSESVRSNPVYQNIKGPKTLDIRYLSEDIPMGLVPFIALGRLIGLPTTRMEIIVDMAQQVLERDLMKEARTLENLGIHGMNVEDFLCYIKTGQR